MNLLDFKNALGFLLILDTFLSKKSNDRFLEHLTITTLTMYKSLDPGRHISSCHDKLFIDYSYQGQRQWRSQQERLSRMQKVMCSSSGRQDLSHCYR